MSVCVHPSDRTRVRRYNVEKTYVVLSNHSGLQITYHLHPQDVAGEERSEYFVVGVFVAQLHGDDITEKRRKTIEKSCNGYHSTLSFMWQ